MVAKGIWGILCVTLIALVAEAAERPAPLLRGPQFHRVWDSSIKAKLDRTPLRVAMGQLCGPAKIAFILDRRLDPETPLTCELVEAPLSSFLPQILEPIEASTAVVGNTIIVGPREPIRWLRTLAVVQRTEMLALPGVGPLAAGRARAIDVHWDDLTEPARLIEELSQKGQVRLTGMEQIPYDLWGGGDLVGVTPGEGITVIAWQYGLRLKWDTATTAQLVPIELPITTAKVLPVPTAKRELARTEFPDLAWEPAGASWRVVGRIEEIEDLERWLKGTPAPRKIAKAPWSSKRYTFKVVDTPVLTVFKGLQSQGFPLTFDEAALTQAGITATSKLDLDVNAVTAEELVRQICQPFKLQYRMTESGVTISAE